MSKPTVTVTLAGDEKRLTQAFENTGTAAQRMKDEVSTASSGMEDVTSASERATEAADGAEGKFIGFTDTISGVQGMFEGATASGLSFGERLAILGQGAADLAGGLASFLIPAISGMWQRLLATSAAQWTLTAAQTAWTAVTTASSTAMAVLNAVMRANPILFVVGLLALLVGGFMLLWNKSEGFRNFFIGMWNGIKSTVGSVVGWTVDRFNDLVSFFTGLPDRIGRAMGALAGIVKNVFKAAVNGVVNALNWFLDHTVNWLINRVNDVSGVVGIPAIPTIPHIPRMHTGGIVPGVGERMIIAQGGEEIIPRGGAGGGGGTVTFLGDLDSAFATYVMRLINNGDIRVAA
jgi:phage-related protein